VLWPVIHQDNNPFARSRPVEGLGRHLQCSGWPEAYLPESNGPGDKAGEYPEVVPEHVFRPADDARRSDQHWWCVSRIVKNARRLRCLAWR